MMRDKHIPVLKEEVLTLLNVKPEGVYADCTMGYGGHGREILSRLDGGIYLGIDKDLYAIEQSAVWREGYAARVIIAKDDYKNLSNIALENGLDGFDGILVDMGVSSVQFDDKSRGFSYHDEGRLDMRMDTQSILTAYEIVNTYSEKELTEILYRYGEEKNAPRIARAIVQARSAGPVEKTTHLTEIIKKAYPPKERYQQKHPARKTYQALRIAVNSELEQLDKAIEEMVGLLKKEGVLCMISFHSLEDRIVKETFRRLSQGCTCPKDFPVCVCGAKADLKLLTKKAVVPSVEEVVANRRSRSAKLRAIKRV